MSSAVATMPSSISSGSTDHRRSDSEAGSRGFTSVNKMTNMTPPQSRESSATSPDVSPRHSTAGAGRHGASSHMYTNSHDTAQHKRKRSMSSEQAISSPRRYDYNPPRKAESEQQHMADRALHVLDSANQHPPNRYYSTTPAGHDRTGHSYERSYSGANGVHASTPEGRLAEAFSRDNSENHYASSANGIDGERLDESQETPHSGQSGQKRKRNFSNRTKTGCITCRQRKKKCDEGRPTCNNCNRGGFECQGYNNSRPSTWPKPLPQKPPILLQSKEDGEQGSYNESATPVSAHPSTTTETPQMRPNVAGDNHDQSRPQYIPNTSNPAPESRPPYSGQPQHPPQWSHQPHHQPPPQPGPSPQSAYPSEHLPPLSTLHRPEEQHPPPQNHYQRPPKQDYTSTAQHEMSRPPTQAQSVAPPPPPPGAVSGPSAWHQHPPQQQQGHPSQQQQGYPAQQQQQQQQQPPPQYPPPAPSQQEYGARQAPYPPRIDTTQPQYPTGGTASARVNTAYTANTANTASASYSSYEQKGSKSFLAEDVERSKMCRGAPYNYFDATLLNERQRCAAALLRYNTACQLTSGVSEGELQSMLEKVFDPKKDTTHSFRAPTSQKGSVGPGVKIEPGFRCTYGYNIRIGENVFVGENTRIDDANTVEIGARTWIGANVTILTNAAAPEMVQRKGTDGQSCSALRVIIGSEVLIGTGAVIYPGVMLGRGSTVEPFAIVNASLGDYATQKAPIGAKILGGALENPVMR